MSSSNTNCDALKRRAQRYGGALLLALLCLLWLPPLQAGDGVAIAVLYPDIAEPFRSVFTKIVEGIEQRAKVRVYAVAASSDLATLNAALKHNGTRVVIALGRQGIKSAAGLDKDLVVVFSGVLAVPELDGRTVQGISLTPDPALLFDVLKKLLPGTRRVIAVCNPQNNEWLLKQAREAARAQGLELLVYEARDLATAARLYENAFRDANARTDALWLPHDATTVDEDTVLPLVLKEAWNRGVAVFSSSFPHVRKGALFALYPNNQALGHDLAAMALAIAAGENGKHGVQPLREVYSALNLRTASHLGLNPGLPQLRNFDFVFPEP